MKSDTMLETSSENIPINGSKKDEVLGTNDPDCAGKIVIMKTFSSIDKDNLPDNTALHDGELNHSSDTQIDNVDTVQIMAKKTLEPVSLNVPLPPDAETSVSKHNPWENGDADSSSEKENNFDDGASEDSLRLHVTDDEESQKSDFDGNSNTFDQSNFKVEDDSISENDEQRVEDKALEDKSSSENERKVEDDSVLENKPKLEDDSASENEPSLEVNSISENNPKVDDNSASENEPSTDVDFISENEQKLEDDSVSENELSMEVDSVSENNQKVDDDSLPENKSTVESDSMSENQATIENDAILEDKPTVENDSIPENEPTVVDNLVSESDDVLMEDESVSEKDNPTELPTSDSEERDLGENNESESVIGHEENNEIACSAVAEEPVISTDSCDGDYDRNVAVNGISSPAQTDDSKSNSLENKCVVSELEQDKLCNDGGSSLEKNEDLEKCTGTSSSEQCSRVKLSDSSLKSEIDFVGSCQSNNESKSDFKNASPIVSKDSPVENVAKQGTVIPVDESTKSQNSHTVSEVSDMNTSSVEDNELCDEQVVPDSSTAGTFEDEKSSPTLQNFSTDAEEIKDSFACNYADTPPKIDEPDFPASDDSAADSHTDLDSKIDISQRSEESVNNDDISQNESVDINLSEDTKFTDSFAETEDGKSGNDDTGVNGKNVLDIGKFESAKENDYHDVQSSIKNKDEILISELSKTIHSKSQGSVSKLEEKLNMEHKPVNSNSCIKSVKENNINASNIDSDSHIDSDSKIELSHRSDSDEVLQSKSNLSKDPSISDSFPEVGEKNHLDRNLKDMLHIGNPESVKEKNYNHMQTNNVRNKEEKLIPESSELSHNKPEDCTSESGEKLNKEHQPVTVDKCIMSTEEKVISVEKDDPPNSQSAEVAPKLTESEFNLKTGEKNSSKSVSEKEISSSMKGSSSSSPHKSIHSDSCLKTEENNISVSKQRSSAVINQSHKSVSLESCPKPAKQNNNISASKQTSVTGKSSETPDKAVRCTTSTKECSESSNDTSNYCASDVPLTLSDVANVLKDAYTVTLKDGEDPLARCDEREMLLANCDPPNLSLLGIHDRPADEPSNIDVINTIPTNIADVPQDAVTHQDGGISEALRQRRKRSGQDSIPERMSKRLRTPRMSSGETETTSGQTNSPHTTTVLATKRQSTNTTQDKDPKKARVNEVPAGMTGNVNTTPNGILSNKNGERFITKIKPEQLKGLTRQELEEFFLETICTALAYQHDLGVLRQKFQGLENQMDIWRKKTLSSQKQVRDLELVVKRFQNDLKTKKDRPVLPVKVTRSVGLQVSLPTTMRSTQPAVGSPNNVATSTPQVSNRGSPSTPNYNRNVAASASVNAPVSGLRAPSKPATFVKTLMPRQPATQSSPNTTPPNSHSSAASARLQQTLRSKPGNNLASNQSKSSGTVIDLTDEGDRTRSSMPRTSVAVNSVSTNTLTATNQLHSSTTFTPGNAIRSVQPHQLPAASATTNTTILPATTANTRLTYLVPSSSNSLQQRPVLVASSSAKANAGTTAVNNVQRNKGAPAGVAVNSAQRNQGSPMYLKTGSLVSVSPVGVKNTTATSQTTSPQATHRGSSLQQASTTPIQSHPPVTNVRSPIRTPMSPMRGTVPVTPLQHPAPLPGTPVTSHQHSSKYKKLPPKPDLKISKQNKHQGIVLSWNMPLTSEHEDIASYQLYAYQESNVPPSTTHWKKVGDVKALPLPMACTLTQFVEGHKYHFAVRAVDIHSRVGPFSLPGSIVLARK